MTIYANLREWLDAAWRAKHGERPFVLKELCEGSGINPPNYYRLEKGNPEASTLEKLARYFDVPIPERVILAREIAEPPRTAITEIREAKKLLELAEEMLKAGERPPLGMVAETPVIYEANPSRAEKLARVEKIVRAVGAAKRQAGLGPKTHRAKEG